jgi:hypothetical protein
MMEKEYIVTLNQDEINLIHIVSRFVGGPPTGSRGVFSGNYYGSGSDNIYALLLSYIDRDVRYNGRGNIIFIEE